MIRKDDGIIKIILHKSIGFDLPDIRSGRKEFICPYCGTKLTFYYASPAICENSACNKSLPPADEILKHSQTRLKWHRKDRSTKKETT